MINFINKHKKTLFISLFCFTLSFLVLLVASKSSPLYPLNDWVDANAFFTMGKSLFNGKILYKDLFEQKGPTLYLIYGFGYLISNASFLGIFIIEVISFSIFLFYAYKIINIFLKDKEHLIILPILSLILVTSKSFVHGGSAEEIMLPMLSFSLYNFINYLYKHELNNKLLFINGLISGLVFTIKYIDVGFWFVFIVCIFIDLLIKRQYKKSLYSLIIYGFGFILPLLIWSVYFLLNNAFFDFINAYFIINIFSYSSNVGFLDKILNSIIYSVESLLINGLIIFILMFEVIYFIRTSKLNMKNKLYFLFAFLFSTILLFIGGTSYKYYILILLPFIIFPLINIAKYFSHKINYIFSSKYNYLIFIISYYLMFMSLFYLSENVYLMNTGKNNLVQYKFAEIINNEENPTLLNFGFLDYGFYTTTNIVPNIKYFQKQNIDYIRLPEIMDEQKRYIKDKLVKFVAIGTLDNLETIETNLPYLLENYELVSTGEQYYEGYMQYYYLFKIKGY